MYGESPAVSAVPVVAGIGTVAVLPATGTGFLTSAAIAVAVGLLTWGVVYFIKVAR